MEESSFWKLLDLIKINVNLEIKKSSAIPNGKILLSAKLSMALRWFAGGSSFDIALYHGVHYQETMKSVWTIVDLVNLCEKIKIQFPSTHTEQEKVTFKYCYIELKSLIKLIQRIGTIMINII